MRPEASGAARCCLCPARRPGAVGGISLSCPSHPKMPPAPPSGAMLTFRGACSEHRGGRAHAAFHLCGRALPDVPARGRSHHTCCVWACRRRCTHPPPYVTPRWPQRRPAGRRRDPSMLENKIRPGANICESPCASGLPVSTLMSLPPSFGRPTQRRWLLCVCVCREETRHTGVAGATACSV